MYKREIFLILIFLKLSLLQDIKSNLFLIEKAKEYQIDLTNPEDAFFHDICQNFKFIKKDITLDYRRKYFFFPDNKNDFMNMKLISQRPIRSNINECFLINNSFSSLITNLAFITFLPLFIVQLSLLAKVLIIKIYDSINNSPNKKNNSSKKFNNNKNNLTTYHQLVPEIKINEINNELKQKEETNNIDMDLSSKKMNSATDNETNIFNQNSKEPINSNKANANTNQNEQNEKENEQKNNDGKKEQSPRVEKSIENYTFGLNFGKAYKFSSSVSIKESKNKEIKDGQNKEIKDGQNNEKRGDKMRRIQYLYEQMNQNKRKINKNNIIKNINSDSPITIAKKKINQIFYVREEYFYFGYLLARIEDKRTFFQIYFDLLEQCQIIFKLIVSPFNIYEERQIQIIYYLLKINIYFLVNCFLIRNSVINAIYDNRNDFIDDLLRSFISTIITFSISLIIYHFTNIKRLLIKRRYRLMNSKINDSRTNEEIMKITLIFCQSFLFNKLIIFSILFSIIFLYSLYFCFCFCNVNYFSQLLLLKCVLLSIGISQITPIFACFLPAFLRKRSLDKKIDKLYDLTKYVELLFVP